MVILFSMIEHKASRLRSMVGREVNPFTSPLTAPLYFPAIILKLNRLHRFPETLAIILALPELETEKRPES